MNSQRRGSDLKIMIRLKEHDLGLNQRNTSRMSIDQLEELLKELNRIARLEKDLTDASRLCGL